MKFKLQFLVCSLFVIMSCQLGLSQVFLQLERYNNPKSIKFYEGDKLEFRLKEFPDTWRSGMIIDLKPEEQLVLFQETYYHINDFSELRLRYPAVKSIGNKLMQFSGAWYLYGGIASLASSEYGMSKKEILLGGSVAALGFLTKKLFYKKRVKLGNKKRLRVMDIRFDVRLGF